MIPTLNFTKIADSNGNLTSEAQLFFQQLIDALQALYTDEGLIPPKQSAANVTKLDNSESTNVLLVNSDTGDLLFNKNGTFKTVQLA